MELLSSTCCFGGEIRRLKHRSEACSCDMVFGVFLPPQARKGPVPALLWLSGLTCTDENFRVKAGAQRYAAELGLALVIALQFLAGHAQTWFYSLVSVGLVALWEVGRRLVAETPEARGQLVVHHQRAFGVAAQQAVPSVEVEPQRRHRAGDCREGGGEGAFQGDCRRIRRTRSAAGRRDDGG